MQQQQPTDRRAARPTTAADLWRLADQGRANGVIILSECVSGARYATSATSPSTIYYLTGFSCTCPGFVGHGRCQHHSLLLAELGWLPDVEDTDSEPAAAAPVPVVDITDERRDDLAERRHRAAQARQRHAARAADPGALDRQLAACNAARLQRCRAAGIALIAR
jgi:hypothetical protein